jgi:HlyD family secretion protein
VRWFTRDEVEVRVVPVTYETLSKTVSTNGKVEPVEEFQAHAPFPGVIRDIYVGVGQKVAKGDLLVKMDDADARARLATAEANLSNALNNQRDIQSGGNREDQNRFKGAASPAEVAAAQQRLDAANLSLATARQHLTQRYNPQDAENAAVHVADARAAVASAEDNLANVIIRSPLKGTVYNVPVNQYDFVPFGYDILDVADLTRLQVRAFFDEPEIGGLAPGQPVKIVWDAKPGEVWHGHVALAPTTIFAYNTRSVGVCIITVDDPTPDLIPNTNVTVSVTEMERPHVLSIPREAWHVDGQRSFVYRIVNGTLVETPVKVGVISLTNVEIVSGLAANDIIVKGAKSSVTDLSNGLRVKQVE